MNLPTEFSVSELAEVLGVSRHKIRRRVDAGVIPSVKVGTGRNGKRVVLTSVLRAHFRELYEAIVFSWQSMDDEEA